MYPTDHVFIFFTIFLFLQIFLINISMKPEVTQTNYLYTWGRMHQPEVWTNPRGIAGVNLKNDIPRMHHAGVNVARG